MRLENQLTVNSAYVVLVEKLVEQVQVTRTIQYNAIGPVPTHSGREHGGFNGLLA